MGIWVSCSLQRSLQRPPACPSCSDGVQNQNESDVDCGGPCPDCVDGKACSVDGDCQSGWCKDGVCETPTCGDGFLNQDEASIDCGGHCPPCSLGKSCGSDRDCLIGWCYNGVCTKSSCDDQIKWLNEEKVDCGGICRACPWIKVNSRAYIRENLTIVVMYPWEGMILEIREPGGRVSFISILKDAGGNYATIRYVPNTTGLYLLRLEGYDEKYVTVRAHEIIPLLEDVPEEVKSLFIPLILSLMFLYLWRRRRTKTVIEEGTLRRFSADSELLEDLIRLHGGLYASADVAKNSSDSRA